MPPESPSTYKTHKIGYITSQTLRAVHLTSSLSIPNCNVHCCYSSWLSLALSLADRSLLLFAQSFNSNTQFNHTSSNALLHTGSHNSVRSLLFLIANLLSLQLSSFSAPKSIATSKYARRLQSRLAKINVFTLTLLLVLLCSYSTTLL